MIPYREHEEPTWTSRISVFRVVLDLILLSICASCACFAPWLRNRSLWEAVSIAALVVYSLLAILLRRARLSGRATILKLITYMFVAGFLAVMVAEGAIGSIAGMGMKAIFAR